VDELVALALRLDRDARSLWYWRVVGELHTRGDQSMFETASRFAIDGPGERERILGIDILDHLGGEQGDPGPFVDQSVLLVEGLAGPGQSAGVLRAAIEALRGFRDNRSTPVSTAVVLAHVNHPDPAVRRAVAHALAPPGVCDNPPPAAVLDAVFALVEDTDADVRGWATFALAHFDVNTPAVRDALAARLGDTHDIAVEALRGLASRHDPRALEPTIRWLEMRDRPPGDFILEVLDAAQTLADSRCLPALHALRDEWDEDPKAFRDARDESRRTSGLAAAIEACERGAGPTE
jgi:HEAT repeat protein